MKEISWLVLVHFISGHYPTYKNKDMAVTVCQALMIIPLSKEADNGMHTVRRFPSE